MNRKISKDEFIHPRKHLKEIKLYVYNPKNQLIWSGSNILTFVDICAQINLKELTGYYVINSLKVKSKITSDGHIGDEDIHYMDKFQNCLEIIMGF